MTTEKKNKLDLASYKIAAAAYRAKIAANYKPQPNEVMPVNGEFHIFLDGKPLSTEAKHALLINSRFDGPEFRAMLKTGK